MITRPNSTYTREIRSLFFMETSTYRRGPCKILFPTPHCANTYEFTALDVRTETVKVCGISIRTEGRIDGKTICGVNRPTDYVVGRKKSPVDPAKRTDQVVRAVVSTSEFLSAIRSDTHTHTHTHLVYVIPDGFVRLSRPLFVVESENVRCFHATRTRPNTSARRRPTPLYTCP